MTALPLLLVLALGVVPTPIGAGPAYHPATGAHGSCRAAPLGRGPRVHVEIFAHRRVVIVPAAIGLRGARTELGRVTAAACRARVWTEDPTGVVRFGDPARLGDLFAVWGRDLGRDQLLGFRGPVALYLNGVKTGGDPRRLRLSDRDEIVLEVGGYVPPHRSYRFPR